MPVTIALIADDLTGAVDGAAPFADRGYRVAVAVDPGGLPAAMALSPDVLAVNSDSRDLPPDAAAGRVADLWSRIAPLDPGLVIKKVDSRLKGPCAAEVVALMEASRRCCALVCPAAPDLGRIVADGRIEGAGVPTPIDVATRLGDDRRLKLVDGHDRASMATAADRVLADPGRILAVGAQGLTSALAAGLRAGRSRHDVPPPGSLLMVIGSRDPVTDAQVERLRRASPGLVEWRAPGGRVAAGPPPAGLTLVRAVDDGAVHSPSALAAGLAAGVAPLVDDRRPATLLLSGGDTALAVLRALGIGVLLPAGELRPGIPWSRTPERPNLRIVSKSGGFGDVDTLADIAAICTRPPVDMRLSA